MIYYIEVNMICIIMLLLFLLQQHQQVKTASTDQRLFHLLIWITIVFCFSDMVAGVFRGRQFPGARAVIEISNLLYFETLAGISFLWSLYVQVRLAKNSTYSRMRLLAWSMPLLLFFVLGVTNPVTHIIFRINENNLYERSFGVYIHWIVVWTYFLVPTFRALKLYVRERSRLKKAEIAPILNFAIAPAIASIMQMVFYGVTTTQVGITISIAMICLAGQNTQVLTDTLTDINNRRGFEKYLADCMQHHGDAVYMLTMIDIDSFKQINDQYGHMTGDLVLQSVARSLKQACNVSANRLFLCRFGGDEFLIFGISHREDEIAKLKDAIETELEKCQKRDGLPCGITVSAGTAVGKCGTEADWKLLLNQADQSMYAEKQRKRTHIKVEG